MGRRRRRRAEPSATTVAQRERIPAAASSDPERYTGLAGSRPGHPASATYRCYWSEDVTVSCPSFGRPISLRKGSAIDCFPYDFVAVCRAKGDEALMAGLGD